MLQVFINGLLLGANLALLALGYTLVFGVMRLLTLAHGAIFMASGLLALLLAGAGTPIWLAGLYAVAIGGLLGLATELFSFRPVGYERPIPAAVSCPGTIITLHPYPLYSPSRKLVPLGSRERAEYSAIRPVRCTSSRP